MPNETPTPRPPHELLLLAMKEQEYQQWRHNPISAAYLLLLQDLAQSFRQAAVDLWEAGRLGRSDDVSADSGTLRGRVLALDELRTLTLGDIHEFYRQPGTEGQDDGNAATADQGPSR